MATKISEPKRTRTRLAKAELWLQVAIVIERWSTYPIEPTATAGTADPLDEIAKVYGLTEQDVQRLLKRMAQEVENRALRSGYEESWDHD